MKRPLALFERTLYADGRLPACATAIAQVGALDESRLRRALDRIQARHPLLRCLVEQRDGRPWFSLQAAPSPIPLRILPRPDDEAWRTETERDLARPFDGSGEPLARLTWLRGAQRSELLLTCHHAICDGRSQIMLLGELFDAYAERPAATGYASLGALEEWFPPGNAAERRRRRRAHRTIGLLAGLLRLVPPGRPIAYGPVYRDFWTLEPQTLRQLAGRCHAEATTIHAALSVAFMQAFRETCARRLACRFVIPVDIHQYRPELAADRLFAVAPPVTLPCRRRRGDPLAAFWPRAREVKDTLRRRIEAATPGVGARLLGMEALHDAWDRLYALAQASRAGRQVTLSNLGRLALAADYDGLRVERVRFAAMLGPTPANLLLACGFAGRLEFSFASDEATLPQAQWSRIRTRAMELLAAGSAPAA